EAREDLHHARIEPAFVWRTGVPGRDVRIVAGELGICRDDAKLLLPLQHPFAIDVPAIVEGAGVPLRPFRPHMMWRMHGAWAEIQEERLLRSDLLGVSDELNGVV